MLDLLHSWVGASGCALPQTATPFMRRKTTSFSVQEEGAADVAYVMLECSFLRE